MQPVSSIGRGLLMAALLAGGLAACSTDSTSPTGSTPASLSVISGDGQTGTTGNLLAAPLIVAVNAADLTPLAGVTVSFAVTAGSGTVSPPTALTDASGRASTQLTLGSAAGAVVVTATVQGTQLARSFSFTASLAVTTDCSTSNTVQLSLGQVVDITSSASLCVQSATSSDYVVIPFNSATSADAVSSVTVRPSSIDASSTIASAAVGVSPSIAGLSGVAASTAIAPFTLTPAAAFHARLRAMEAALLAPHIGAARRWNLARQARTTALRSAIPTTPNVGQTFSLNANGNDACTAPQTRVARVAAVTNRAIVVADTGNPLGGFTDAEYQSIGVAFDTLIDPLATANFGEPSDIDGNGRVVLFFTRAVNALTARNSKSYVGGFFFARDLFPTTATTGFDGCATSNVGEMFYLLVPDPGGTVNGNAFAKSTVSGIIRSIVAHEYQHLINASRRMYVNTSATDFEADWLNEGLSHVAEELLFYADSKLQPGQNYDVTALRSSSAYVAAFNADAISNFGRFEDFLRSPSINSPYADNDSLATRGATWAFLRYAADHSGNPGATVWRALVNSTATGFANLQQVFAQDVTALFHDWSVSLIADDVTGIDPKYQQPSWNFRSIFSVLDNSTIYPLKTIALSSGSATTIQLSGGGSAFLGFSVGAGKTGSVGWDALPANVQLTVVRIR